MSKVARLFNFANLPQKFDRRIVLILYLHCAKFQIFQKNMSYFGMVLALIQPRAKNSSWSRLEATWHINVVPSGFWSWYIILLYAGFGLRRREFERLNVSNGRRYLLSVSTVLRRAPLPDPGHRRY
ncbi:hypothetical protein DFS33DRAFT_1272344 [Desarmillaria ectypa]|nr:hypothetical protein DFS33DRAFT_1272344 [Desarmillaria ectypa]